MTRHTGTEAGTRGTVPTALLTALLVTSVLLVSCGTAREGGEVSIGEDDPTALLARAITGMEDAATGRFEGATRTEGGGAASGALRSLDVTFDGAFDLGTGRSRLVTESTSQIGLLGFVTEVVVDGQTVYTRMAQDRASLDGEQWMSMTMPDEAVGGRDGLGAMFGGQNPASSVDVEAILDQLRSAGDVVEMERTEVRGVPVRHLQATVDLGALARQELERSGEPAPERFADVDWVSTFDGLTMDYELFIDDAGAIRRITTVMDLGSLYRRLSETMSPAFEAMVEAADAEFDGAELLRGLTTLPAVDDLTLYLEFDFFDLGAPVVIDVPDAASVDDVDVLRAGPQRE